MVDGAADRVAEATPARLRNAAGEDLGEHRVDIERRQRAEKQRRAVAVEAGQCRFATGSDVDRFDCGKPAPSRDRRNGARHDRRADRCHHMPT